MAESSRLVSQPGGQEERRPTGDAAVGDDERGGSSLDTILNVINIAFGAGMLGLPYAIQGAGLLSGVAGMGIVLYWNYYCCALLVKLRDEVLKARTNAAEGSALAADEGKPVSFVAMGNYAMGTVGTVLVCISVVVTLLGAATAYFINANELLRKTRFYLNPGWSEDTAMYANTLIYMCIMYPLTCIKSLAPLSRLSFPAICALVAGFAVIIKLGLDMHGWPPAEEVISWEGLYIPRTFAGFSTFFGTAAFSYGATIIIPNIQESMERTDDFMGALQTSLWIIWGSYSVLGGVSLVIYQQQGPVSDNIMAQLPSGSAAQEPLLLFITAATLLTYPLAMQPVSSMLTEALLHAGFGGGAERMAKSGRYGALSAAETGTTTPTAGGDGPPAEGEGKDRLPLALYYGLRAGLVLFTAVGATSVPNFGVVVSLLGSFSVTLGSFVLPPLFHRVVFGDRLSALEKAVDEFLVLLGVVTCAFTTATTALGQINGG